MEKKSYIHCEVTPDQKAKALKLAEGYRSLTHWLVDTIERLSKKNPKKETANEQNN